jgi:hypothetical protein
MLLKKLFPHLVVIGIFFAITLIYFSSVIFGGKEIFQEDVMRYKGISREIIDFRKKYGEEPFWTNALFCGMPAYQISVKYIASNLDWVNKLLNIGIPAPPRYVFFSFLGFYFLLLVLRLNPWLAMLGALGFGLSSYLFIIIDAGHNSKAAAMSYMAPVLAGVILIYRGKLFIGGAVVALFLSLELFSNHPQITYYLGFIILFYVISELFTAWKEKKIGAFFKRSAVVGIASVIATGVNITSIWATADYSQYTIRGRTELTINPDGIKNVRNVTSGLDKDYATAWSYGVGETMTLLIPNFKGGASSPIGENEDVLEKVDPEKREAVSHMYAYFGDQPFTSGPVYMGAIIMFFFVLGVFIVKGPFKWALVATTIFSIWLSWGRNDPFGLTDFMLDYFPAYNKFRAVAMTLVMAGVTIPLLAVLAIHEMFNKKNFWKENISLLFKQSLSGQKVLIAAFFLTGGIALICWVAPGMFTEFHAPNEFNKIFDQIKQSNPQASDDQVRNYLNQVMPALETAREAIVKADARRSFFFILLAAVTLWLFAKNQLNQNLTIGILTVLIIMDMAVVNKRYLNANSFREKNETENPFAIMGRPHAADREIMKDTSYYRVWNTLSRPDQDAATSYFHKSISGYHGAKLRRYQELIDFHINRRNMEVINMLNTKYIIIPGGNNQPQAILNNEALGSAWFVEEYRLVANADSEIIALSHFKAAKTAIVDKRFKGELQGFHPRKDSLGYIRLTSYKPNHLIYESNASFEQLAVFSEIYYPSGWNAYIDGQRAPHFRANYVLRCMRIPAGKHTVEFKFEPEIIAIGEKISVASMSLLVLLIAGASFYEWKNSKIVGKIRRRNGEQKKAIFVSYRDF